jgi:segregation and condensation protein B
MPSEDRQPAESVEVAESETSASREPEEISLDKLSSAFAEMLESDDDTDPHEDDDQQATDTDSEDGPVLKAAQLDEDDGPGGDVSPLTILEAMLFVGNPNNQPLGNKYLASLMRGVSPREIDDLVEQLNARYREDGCPYSILDDGPGYRLVLRESFRKVQDKFYSRARQVKLSQAAIEVLALVSYNQPITSEEVSRHRGAGSGAILSQLVRRQLLRIERPDEKPRKANYFTTDRFLSLFGLRSIEELPRSQELDKQ